ncbi:hypothetical protein CUJ83_12670 [Methanocella sp. CWC-04]|uniref:Uncharacterized protein n=1 Tax=Methanooceanicella nereidis TaxID=2052831 RepID=A0AAP2RDW5_9EURY|nr:hypothetical protein [Methanocella sp. CWC-04]MCD1295849.1 hypothetical protein [Methanocella sp. CWC-04]
MNNVDDFDEEQAAVSVFSYLIRGLAGESRNINEEKRKVIKAELIEKMAPMKRLYAMSDELFPIYVDFCIANKKFLKIPETIKVFGDAISANKVSAGEEKVMMEWVKYIMNNTKTTGNIKTKRR